MKKPLYPKFENRREAGILLAQKLKPMVQDEHDLLVLGLPRGGVPVAREVAQALDAPLDILVVRKLGIPGHEETAMGAIASGGFRTLDAQLIWKAGISDRAIHRVIKRERRELKRRESVYRGGCPPLVVRGRTVILVDDGIATGSTVLVALKVLREGDVSKVIIATPVCAFSTFRGLQHKADTVVSLMVPDPFYAVGAWYVDFSATQDEEVCQLLELGRLRSHPLTCLPECSPPVL
jgi:putative phosphoribosyl transferase